jgi:DNA-binding MarR family transcriptional regulator
MTTSKSIDPLRLDQQICFPLYAVSRLVTRLYQPLLEPLSLTYPQYVILMVLWQQSPQSVSELGARTLLRSNTLTPLLKRLEAVGLVRRSRDSADERVVEVALTPKGSRLRSKCEAIPRELASRIGFPADKAANLKALLGELFEQLLQNANVPATDR